MLNCAGLEERSERDCAAADEGAVADKEADEGTRSAVDAEASADEDPVAGEESTADESSAADAESPKGEGPAADENPTAGATDCDDCGLPTIDPSTKPVDEEPPVDVIDCVGCSQLNA